MPETERKLFLHSPASSEIVEYRWPLTRTETWDEAVEIVESIRWVCRDFPDLKLAVEKFILNSFEPTSYDSMKQLCERYNRAVANIKKLWSGRQPPPGIDAPPTIPLLRHIITQAYNRSVTNPDELNSYEPFSPEVYGETSFELVTEVMKLTKMTENDIFLDLGSGVGQVVLQVAAKVGCKCYGVEKAETPAKFAESMEEEFVRWMEWYGKSYGEFELIKGDFLDPAFDDILQSATVIFTNNFAFGPKLNHELKLKFANLKDGTKIVSSHEFCSLNFRVTSRNMSDIGSIMHVAELSSLKGSVSWTGKQVSYYLHTIDRGKLEKFYLRQKHPDEYKSESSSHSSSSSSDEDSCSESSSDSDDDHFKSALQRIKLTHSRPGGKKDHLNSDPKVRSGKAPKVQGVGEGEEERWRKKRWAQLKCGAQKDSNSSALSSSAVSSPGVTDFEGLFSSFHRQLEAYMGQLNTPYFQQWIVDAIEKEKMKKNHLQGVITHLESEVAGLSKETVDQMKASMKELGIQKMTPDGLLLGATSIVSQNKQLRKEMIDLEREITALRQQNKAMEAMCARQKGDPKLLPHLPLGEPLTNGISSPHHVTSSSGEGELSEPAMEITKEELEGAMLLLVDAEILLSTLGPKHMCLGLVREYEIELERIDQQLLELGPYAQDAYDDEETPAVVTAPVVVSPPVPPPDTRKGRKGKQSAAQKGNRSAARGADDVVETQRGGWRGGGGGWTEVRQEEKEAPKKKWRKVGSAGPAVRGKEGQLDAQSDPLNVSSANLILTPTGGQRGSCDPLATHPLSAQITDRPGGVIGAATGPPSVSVSTTAHSTPSCNTSSPSELPGHARAQPTAHWRPVSSGGTPTHQDLARGDTSEEIDVTRIDGEATPNGPHPGMVSDGKWRESPTSEYHLSHQLQARRGSHSSKPSHSAEVLMADGHRTQVPPSSPQTTPHGHRPNETVHPHMGPQQYHHQTTSMPKHPGFSISNLAKGSDTPPQSHDNHVASYIEHRGPGSTSSVPSPRGDFDGGVRKRRSSSSSSHRSARHSMDDNSLARSGSPLSSHHSRGQYGVIWDGSANSPGNKDKLQMLGAMESGKTPGMSPFAAMWPPGVPVPTDPAQMQRLSLSSPFLAASNPWLRGGVIPGLPFRPALYPTGAATAATNSLDPAHPYKSMLSLSLYPSFSGLKGSFPTPAFTAPNSASSSQPQTPSAISSANPGFSFGQFPMPQALSANAALQDAQSRFPGQLVPQPSSFAVGMDAKQRGSPEGNQDTPQPWPMIPGMPMLQTPLGFGLQNTLPSSISQASLLAAAQRGSTPFSTSPLTLVTQSAWSAGEIAQQQPGEVYHHQAGSSRRGKKQPTIDLTGRHIEAPSPQEAVKMATQRMSPFHDPSRFSPKLKGVSDGAPAPPSSSPLIPNFVGNPNALSSQAQGSVLSYPLPGGAGLVNPAQLMGVAMPGNPMLPVNYQPLQNVVGKPEESSGKKRSPKRGGGGAQKLRIHQMEFKQQGKVDRRRRRPWKAQEKPDEAVKPVASAQSRITPPVSLDQPPQASQEDNYALNMLADCSSKEGEKSSSSPLATATTPPNSAKQSELASKRALMRSPGSIAGANSLLLLAKPDQVPPSRPRDSSPPETAVVDGLLQLSNSSVPASSISAQEQSHSGIQNQSLATSQLGLLPGSEGGEGGRKEKVIPGPLSMTRRRTSEEGRERDDTDSEKTDTDSEATLSPTTPAPISSATITSTPRLGHTTASPPPLPPPGHLTHTQRSSSTPVASSGEIGQVPPTSTSLILPPSRDSAQSEGEAVLNQGSISGVPVQAERETMDSRIVDLQPSSLTSTRLQPVDDEEGDADVDVENIDSSLTDEPAQPVLNPFSVVQPSHPVPSPPVVEKSDSLAPEIAPTSPLPPPSLQDNGNSLLPPSPESRSEVGVAGGVVSVDEPPSLPHPLNDARDETEEPPVDVSPPTKRQKLEEEVEQKREEVEGNPAADEQMDTVLSPPEPAVSKWGSPPCAPPSPPAPLPPANNGTDPSSLSEHPPPLSPPPPPDPLIPSTTNESKVKPTEESLNVSSDGAPSYPATEESSATEEPFSSPEYREKIGNNLNESGNTETQTNTAEEGASPDRVMVETNGFHSDTSAGMAGSESEMEKAREEPQRERDTVSPTACISWPSETEEEDGGKGELSQIGGSPMSSPHRSQPDASAGSEAANISSPTKTGSVSPHHDDTMTTGAPVKRAISPIRPPDSRDTPPQTYNKTEENKPQTKEPNTTATKPRPLNDAAPPETGRRASPPVVQNRLPVGKSGFDRSRKLTSQHVHKQHQREEKSSGGSKKWSRGLDPGSRGRGLFDVDPQEGAWRSKVDGRPSDRDQVKHVSSSEVRKVKSRPPPSGHTHPSKPSSGERTKHGNSSRPRGEDAPARYSRPVEPHPVGGAWDQREAGSGKPKPRPGDHQKDWDETPDDDQTRGAGRGKGYQNSHGVWREDRSSPTDHTRERGHTPSKHKPHRDLSKSGFEHVRKLARVEKDKHVSTADSSDERGAAAVFKRHRGGDDDSDHTPSSRLKHGSSGRKRSYESVSEEEILEDSRCSSRESSLVADDRTRSDRHSSQEGDQRWRKEGKRMGEGGDGTDEFVRLKHKKHKHDSKDRKERRKWRKLGDTGGDLKLKRGSDDKPRLGYHKH